MKTNKKLFTLTALALIATMGLSGCNSHNGSTNEITQSQTSSEITPTNPIDAMISNLEKGFTMNGRVYQSRIAYEIKNDGQIIPHGEAEAQDYGVKIMFENSKDRVGTSVVQLGNLEGYESVINELSAYLDEDGNCYQEYLDYKNDIQTKHLMEGQNKLSFVAAGLNNFAEILNSNDFVYDKDLDEYNVNLNKIGVVLKNLLGHINTGFFYKPTTATMSVKDGNFATLDVGIEEFETTNFEGEAFIKTKFKNRVEFTIENIGTTKLTRIEKYPAKAENAELKTAFNNIKNNMTLDVESRISINEGATDVSYRQFRFDGENVLVHDYDDPHRKGLLNTDNHFVLKTLEGSQSDSLYCHTLNIADGGYVKKEHKKFAKNYQGLYYYDQLLPNPSAICSDFFTYDADVNEYVVIDNDIIDQVEKFLTVSKDPLGNEYALNANKIGIRLGSDGNIKYVKYYVDYQDVFQYTYVKGFVKVNFTKINETTLGVKL